MTDKSKWTVEQKRLNLEQALRTHERNDAMMADSRKFAIEAANVAIRAMLLINGGAVVALLAFIGTLESGNHEAVDVKQFVSALRWFAYGVGLAAVSAGLAYLVNMLDTDILQSRDYTWDHPYVVEQPKQAWLIRIRVVLHLLAIALAVMTLTSFFLGINGVVDAVVSLGL
ncbi:hypothetical protein [Shimia biformata]|uniref:hypothetical protein n=1 Tax=Shimia biformata TaxID=1294299 RepID=UPI0019506E6B|nr:hypothetical protein [Shimia biformata]